MENIVALIPAAGVGRRFGATIPKQYVEILGKSVLEHTLTLLSQEQRITQIAIVVSPNDEWIDAQKLPEKAQIFRVGGAERAETVYNGIKILKENQLITNNTPILVHDAARCCLPLEALSRLLDNLCKEGAILAIPVSDTLKKSTDNQTIDATLPRQQLWHAQTPQLFYTSVLEQALEQVDKTHITDEASAVEKLGIQPRLIMGDSRNIKLTREEDRHIAQFLLQSQL